GLAGRVIVRHWPERIVNPTACRPGKVGCTVVVRSGKANCTPGQLRRDGAFGYGWAESFAVMGQFMFRRAKNMPSRESRGKSMGEHEEFHVFDVSRAVLGFVNSIKSEGFSSEEECEAARQRIDLEIDERLRKAEKASVVLRDVEGDVTW